MRQELISIRGMATGARRARAAVSLLDGGLAIADREGGSPPRLDVSVIALPAADGAGLGTLSGMAWTVLF